jgi:hypothetical protein
LFAFLPKLSSFDNLSLNKIEIRVVKKIISNY